MSEADSSEPTRLSPDSRGLPVSETVASRSAAEDKGTAWRDADFSATQKSGDVRFGFPVVPGYEILEEIARGGMGVVYKARQVGLNRLVALKMILAGAHADASQLARFRSEAQAVARLRHPHIVQVYDIGEHDGLPYFALELVEGGSLARRLARQPQPPAVAAHLVEQLARAVHFAHTQGIIHRDLKPANILLEKDEGGRMKDEKDKTSISDSSFILHPSSFRPKITDFGLAKGLDDGVRTHSGAIIGTPSYMPPEQARGDSRSVGPAADQYALGAILYDLLTGRPPFKGTTLLDTLEQVQTREAVPPSQLQARLPADLETICLKCLQKEPRKRYGSALELADDLRRFQEGQPIVARPVGGGERLLRWARRNPRVAALLGAVALLLLALAGVSWLFTLRLSWEKEAVVRAKGEADENARAAAGHARRALDAKTRADENARLAEEQASLAIEALGALVSKAQTLLEDAPNSVRPRQELLKLALELFQKVERGSRPGLAARSMAAAHKKMGEICLLNDRKDDARQHYEKGLAITAALREAAPDNDAALGNYAVFLATFGDWARDQDKNVEKARDFYERALRLQTDALHVTGAGAELTQAEKKLSVAATHDRLGTLAFNLGNTAKNNDTAEQHFAAALALRESALAAEPTGEALPMLAQSHFFLGAVQARRHDTDGTLDHYVKARTYRRRFYEANRHSVKARHELAELSDKIGALQFVKKEYTAARQSFDESLKLRRELYAADTSNGLAQRRLSYACYRSAAAAQARGDQAAAKAGFAECLRLRRDYAKAAPNDVNAYLDLMLACARVGEHAEAARLAEEEVRRRAGKDFRALFQIACCYSLCVAAATRAEAQTKYASEGVAALEQARALGYQDVKTLDTEPDLEPLRQRPEFQAFRAALPK